MAKETLPEKPTKPQLLKLAHDHIVNNDVEWTALDTFRVWANESYTDFDGTMVMDIKSYEFVITRAKNG